jgi:hypothetical protein
MPVFKMNDEFVSRQTENHLRQLEATSMARTGGFNKEYMRELFSLLGNTVDDYKLDNSRFFNMDETALSTLRKTQKILTLRGKYQVGAITSGGRGTNTTCLYCMKAAATFVPPMLIFRRLRFKQKLSGVLLVVLNLYVERANGSHVKKLCTG